MFALSPRKSDYEEPEELEELSIEELKELTVGFFSLLLILLSVFLAPALINYASEQVHELIERATARCPVANSSTSFCVMRDGKPYYFAVIGWELPSVEDLRKSIPRDYPFFAGDIRVEPPYVWLRVKTNLELEIGASEKGYAGFGELFREVLSLGMLEPIKSGDELLLPYTLPESYETMGLLKSARVLRLHFATETHLLPSEGCIGGVCFAGEGFYVNVSPPPVELKVLDLQGGYCRFEDRWHVPCLYNVTLQLEGGYLLLYFFYDEHTGAKSEAHFPVEISSYSERGGKTVFLGAPLSTVIPPLPSSATDVWEEPEHNYLATILPPGRFTLVFRTWDAFYPETLLSCRSATVGTPWGGVDLPPQPLEVLGVTGVGVRESDGGIAVEGVNVTLRNSGTIPVPIPEAMEFYEIPPNYTLLRGFFDSTPLVLTALSGRGEYHGGLAFVINPGEVAVVPMELWRLPDRSLGVELPITALGSEHTLLIGTCSGNFTVEIPPLKPKITLVNATLHRDATRDWEVDLDVVVNVTNTWLWRVRTEWLRAYIGGRPLESLFYERPYEEIEPNASKVLRLSFTLTRDRLQEYLLNSESLSLCMGATCVSIPLCELTQASQRA